MDYNFIIASPNEIATGGNPEEPRVPFDHGPNLEQVTKMTPRKFANSVLQVYQKLGGNTWLLTQAIAAPQEFMKLLAKLLPKQMDLGGLEGLSIRLIDQFGQAIELNASAVRAEERLRPVDAVGGAVASGRSLPLPSSCGSGQPVTVAGVSPVQAAGDTTLGEIATGGDPTGPVEVVIDDSNYTT